MLFVDGNSFQVDFSWAQVIVENWVLVAAVKSYPIVKRVDLEIEGLLPSWLFSIFYIFRTIFSIVDLDFYLGVRLASKWFSLSD